MKQITIIARYEIQRLIKSKWLISFSLLFTILTLALVLVSKDLYKTDGDIGFSRLYAALYNLAVILIPLVSLSLAALSVSGDKSDKFILLLKTIPLDLSKYITGKYLGICVSTFASILAGFIFVSVFNLVVFKTFIITNILTFLLLASILILTFTSIGIYLGIAAKNRMGALITGLLLWFFLIFIYELIVWNLLPLISFGFQKPVLIAIVLLNPAEFLRIGITFLQKQGAIYGETFYYWQEAFNTIAGFLCSIVLIIIYAVLPLLLALLKSRKEKI